MSSQLSHDSVFTAAVVQDGEKNSPNQTPERSSASVESRPQESLKQEPSTNHTSENVSHNEGLHTGDSGQETGGTGSMSQQEETNGRGKDDDENGEDSAMPPWLKNVSEPRVL